MHLYSRSAVLALVSSCPLIAGTVVITSVPDDQHPLAPLTSLGGIPLASGVQVRIGAFPGMSDAQLMDAASTIGLPSLIASFVPFGATFAIGDGADGVAGTFEIAVKENSSTPHPAWVGEEISLLIQSPDGEECLIARFDGALFEADPATGLEPLLSLHLADADVIVGNCYGSSKFATSSAPSVGSFSTWISSFSNITDPAMLQPDADADGDGRSNFLEYATSGNPDSADDLMPCQVVSDSDGGFWICFSRATGLGSVRYTVERSTDFIAEWQPLPGTIEPDPDPPLEGSSDWMRIRVPTPAPSADFFRLRAAPSP